MTKTVYLQPKPTILLNTLKAYTTPTFITEVLHLVTNVQLLFYSGIIEQCALKSCKQMMLHYVTYLGKGKGM